MKGMVSKYSGIIAVRCRSIKRESGETGSVTVYMPDSGDHRSILLGKDQAARAALVDRYDLPGRRAGKSRIAEAGAVAIIPAG